MKKKKVKIKGGGAVSPTKGDIPGRTMPEIHGAPDKPKERYQELVTEALERVNFIKKVEKYKRRRYLMVSIPLGLTSMIIGGLTFGWVFPLVLIMFMTAVRLEDKANGLG